MAFVSKESQERIVKALAKGRPVTRSEKIIDGNIYISWEVEGKEIYHVFDRKVSAKKDKTVKKETFIIKKNGKLPEVKKKTEIQIATEVLPENIEVKTPKKKQTNKKNPSSKKTNKTSKQNTLLSQRLAAPIMQSVQNNNGLPFINKKGSSKKLSSKDLEKMTKDFLRNNKGKKKTFRDAKTNEPVVIISEPQDVQKFETDDEIEKTIYQCLENHLKATGHIQNRVDARVLKFAKDERKKMLTIKLYDEHVGDERLKGSKLYKQEILYYIVDSDTDQVKQIKNFSKDMIDEKTGLTKDGQQFFAWATKTPISEEGDKRYKAMKQLLTDRMLNTQAARIPGVVPTPSIKSRYGIPIEKDESKLAEYYATLWANEKHIDEFFKKHPELGYGKESLADSNVELLTEILNKKNISKLTEISKNKIKRDTVTVNDVEQSLSADFDEYLGSNINNYIKELLDKSWKNVREHSPDQIIEQMAQECAKSYNDLTEKAKVLYDEMIDKMWKFARFHGEVIKASASKKYRFTIEQPQFICTDMNGKKTVLYKNRGSLDLSNPSKDLTEEGGNFYLDPQCTKLAFQEGGVPDWATITRLPYRNDSISPIDTDRPRGEEYENAANKRIENEYNRLIGNYDSTIEKAVAEALSKVKNADDETEARIRKALTDKYNQSFSTVENEIKKVKKIIKNKVENKLLEIYRNRSKAAVAKRLPDISNIRLTYRNNFSKIKYSKDYISPTNYSIVATSDTEYATIDNFNYSQVYKMQKVFKEVNVNYIVANGNYEIDEFNGFIEKKLKENEKIGFKVNLKPARIDKENAEQVIKELGGPFSKLAKAIFINRFYDCIVAATYFQRLVSYTPEDDNYYNFEQKAVKVVHDKVKFTENYGTIHNGNAKVVLDASEVVEKGNYRLKEYSYTRKTHEADEIKVKGDWVLHYKGMNFKAFKTKKAKRSKSISITATFLPEYFNEPDDINSIYEIAMILYQYVDKKEKQIKAKKAKRINNDNFSATNISPYWEHLEYGYYRTKDTKPRKGSKYGKQHGLSNHFSYQAPMGFWRIAMAQWNMLVSEGGTEAVVSKFLNLNKNKLDISNVESELMQRILTFDKSIKRTNKTKKIKKSTLRFMED